MVMKGPDCNLTSVLTRENQASGEDKGTVRWNTNQGRVMRWLLGGIPDLFILGLY